VTFACITSAWAADQRPLTTACVDSLGNLLALKVTAANEQERQQVAELAAKVQEVTGGSVEIAFVDQGDTGKDAACQASENGIRSEVLKHNETKKGFVLLPRWWVVERTLGWLGRFRRLARDYERLANVLAGWHWFAFLFLLLDGWSIVNNSLYRKNVAISWSFSIPRRSRTVRGGFTIRLTDHRLMQQGCARGGRHRLWSGRHSPKPHGIVQGS
jgi:transposase